MFMKIFCLSFVLTQVLKINIIFQPVSFLFTEPVKEVSVVIIKPDAVKSHKSDEIIKEVCKTYNYMYKSVLSGRPYFGIFSIHTIHVLSLKWWNVNNKREGSEHSIVLKSYLTIYMSQLLCFVVKNVTYNYVNLMSVFDITIMCLKSNQRLHVYSLPLPDDETWNWDSSPGRTTHDRRWSEECLPTSSGWGIF